MVLLILLYCFLYACLPEKFMHSCSLYMGLCPLSLSLLVKSFLRCLAEHVTHGGTQEESMEGLIDG